MASNRKHRGLAPGYFLLAVALLLFSRTSGAQTWTGALDGARAIPMTTSQATGTVTMTLSGTTLVVLMSWHDLTWFAAGAELQAGEKRSTLVWFREFPGDQSGSYSARIDLADPRSYGWSFLREHENKTDAARAALVAALDAGEGYVFIGTQQPLADPEIGGRVRRISRRE